MAVSNGTIKDIVSSLKTDTKIKNSTYQAEVTRIDKQTGVAYVRLAGSDRETPTELTAAEVKKGDSVTVEWRNNKLYIGGNYSSPSVGTQRILIVEKDIGTAQQTADTANETAKTAKKVADTAKQIADNTDQYFWHTETGTDTGAHITEVPKEDFEADPTNGGGNLLARSNGIAVRDGLTELATFGASGAQIGQSGAAHSVIDTNGQRFYASNGTTQLANIGYGEGTAESGTATAPYYTFGTRESGSTIGNYSMAEGQDCIASGFASHAEGSSYSTSSCSHSEGTAIANGGSSHAEGGGISIDGISYETEANRFASHAEGLATQANGVASHSQGYFTKASSDYQTAIGKCNIEDTSNTYVVIIGNGTNRSTRSNALTVDWNGNIETAGDITVGGHSSPIGDVQSASWTATSSAASTTNLTNEITLTPGTWMIVVSLPTVSRTHQYMLTNISSAENKYYSAVSMGTFTCVYQATSTTTTRVRSAAATSTTYSNITRGHIEAVRIA